MLIQGLDNFRAALNTQDAQDSLLASQLSDAQTQITSLQNQLAGVPVRPVVFEDLETTPWLIAGGTVANTGAAGNSADSVQTQPGVTSASFKLIPAGSYADKYWYKQLGPHPTLTRFEQHASFLFPAASDANVSQAVETDLQQCINGVVYNFGTQCDFAEGSFRIWNRSAGAWVSIIPLTRPASGTWMNIVLNCHRDGSAVFYDSISINGTTVSFAPVSFPAPTLGLLDMLNYGFQLDGNKAGTAYTVSVDRMKLVGRIK